MRALAQNVFPADSTERTHTLECVLDIMMSDI